MGTSSSPPSSASDKPNPPGFHEQPTLKPGRTETPPAEPEADEPKGFVGKLKAWAKRHHKALWWLHSAYALFLGFLVILFAAKGFDYARILAATLGGTFLVMVILFRIFGQGISQKHRREEKRSLTLSFLGMTYVLKNLYQGMLFFVLPFYWKSSSFDSINVWFVFLLGTLAILSTLDLVFDNLLMRYRTVAAIYYAVTLFACANLIIPAFFSNVPTLVALLASTVASVFGFWLLHFPLRTLRERRTWAILTSVSVIAVLAMYFARFAMPPVPLYVAHNAVGLAPLEDGRLELEVTRVHKKRLDDLYAVSDIVMPGGQGDEFRHRWRHKKGDVDFRQEKDATLVHLSDDAHTVRVRSSIPREDLEKADPVGDWVVDIITTDDMIVGRMRFEVIE